MSKKTPVKKSKRRLKRSVRRSLAAVLMITSIAVAAIPVPENAAATAGENARAEAGVEVLQNYAYPQNLPSIELPYNGIPVNLKLEQADIDKGNTYTTYFIDKSTTNGQTVYTMNWQFDFFMRKIQKVNYGIIYDYNHTAGHVSLLEVPKHPIYNYALASLDKVNTFIATHYGDPVNDNPGTEVVTDWGRPGDDTEKDEKIKTYFGEDYYNDRVREYQKYDADLAAWNRDKVGDKPDEPAAITKYASEFGGSINEQWRLFYCEKTKHTYTITDAAGEEYESSKNLTGYILEPVVDATNSGAQTMTVYIPRKLDTTVTEGETIDEHGFLVQDTTSIIGIAEKAFENVQDVDVIALDSDIQYIGDSAFAGSFIQGIETYAENIGNRAFYNCKYLKTVTLQDGVQRIGTEAFAREPELTSIEFPASIKYVGLGSFASCSALRDVDFSRATEDTFIDDYAFYDDINLTQVNFLKTGTEEPVEINTVGKAAFAVRKGITGGLVNFVFPSGISAEKKKLVSNKVDSTTGEPVVDLSYDPFGSDAEIGQGSSYRGLGDYIFAGRVNLQQVTMPSSYGSTTEQKVPDYLFFNCIALKRLIFPHTGTSCGLATFDPKKLFATVSNRDFCVEGPELMQPALDTAAYPRQKTWEAESAVSKVIPYIYYKGDPAVEYREVSDGMYLECIDETGVLIDCKLKPPVPDEPGDIYLPIPSEVAGVKVTGIDTNCFKDDRLNQNVVVLTIMDGSELKTINASVFKGWDKLQKVYIGDSVRYIGQDAFADCRHLIDVTFNTPEGEAGNFKVEPSAFKTNGTELTFHGLIDESYGPYQFAMDKANTIGPMKIRICYKSMLPSYLTVMHDRTNNEITLLDYPKYDQIGNLLGEELATQNNDNWRDMGYKTAEAYYNAMMEKFYYNQYAGDEWGPMRDAFKEAWNNASKAEDVYTDFTVYGPWVTEDYVNTAFIDSGQEKPDTDPDSNQNLDQTSAFDWLFEPLIAEAAPDDEDIPLAYFSKYHYDVYKNYDRLIDGTGQGSYQISTEDEKNAFLATQEIKVPDGITSIDVWQYFKDEGATAGQYLSARVLGNATRNMYWEVDDSGRSKEQNVDTVLTNEGTDYSKSIIAGLFSGTYQDKKPDITSEGNPDKGNDRLREIDLNQVKSLPAYAFDSCDNLQKVTIGKDCDDIGQLPFRGCPSLTTLNVAADNKKYFSENRILYARNTEDKDYDPNNPTYTLVECLESRGKDKANKAVTSPVDLSIESVTKIARAAFEECNLVSTINLTSASGLKDIPENCFKGCDALDEVTLPATLNKIDKGAFYDDYALTEVTIPGREVFISTDAFKNEGTKKPNATRIRTYADSSARRYADTYETVYNLLWEDIGDLWTVNFYDYDGSLVKTLSVKGGDQVKPKERPEMSREGYKFEGWLGTNGVDVENDEITQDTDFIAQYSSTSQMVGGKWPVDFYDMTGEPFWPTQFVEDGKTIAEDEDASFPPTKPYHEGYKFLKYVAYIGGKLVDFTEDTEITTNVKVTAVYEVDGAGGAGGNGTTSGSSTANNGNTSGSSSNTSGSSTSTTSSGETKTRHTVTVVNGYGSGSYAEGETVIIVANEPAEGQKFSQWRTQSEGVELVHIQSSATTFKMPANDVLVVAEFTAGSSKPTTTALQTPASGTVATNTGTTGNSGNNANNGNTRVDITKPGISNKNLATANVNGSTDNFIVKISETPEATQAVINALTNKYGNLDNILYYAMDISLYDSTGTTKITDTTGLSVDITVPIPDALVAYGGNNMMGAVIGNNQLEDMSERFTTIAGVPCISFTATHFSPYTIYVNTQNLSEGLLDVTPKTGDPIHPKWFLSIGLAALSIILFMKKDKKVKVKTA